LQAAILRIKLPHLDAWNEQRRQLAAGYAELLNDTGFVLPQAVDDVSHVYHLYVVRAKGRDSLLDYLRARGIGAQVHYPVPVHLQPAYADLGFGPGSLPETERAANEVLSLPLYPEMEVPATMRVFELIQQWIDGGNRA
jgi:dTDP-4-amino-4,6-dideoxygalactose transaminase